MPNNQNNQNQKNNDNTSTSDFEIHATWEDQSSIRLPWWLVVFALVYFLGSILCIYNLYRTGREAEEQIEKNNKMIAELEVRSDSLSKLSVGISKDKEVIRDTIHALKLKHDVRIREINNMPVDSLCRVFMRELDSANVQ